MKNLRLKKTILYMTIGPLWALGIAPCPGQTLSLGIVQDPRILVSAGEPSNKGKNLESTLVVIKAVDAPTSAHRKW